eukprot:6208584-Pleurochrysis_carterae.AAC.1
MRPRQVESSCTGKGAHIRSGGLRTRFAPLEHVVWVSVHALACVRFEIWRPLNDAGDSGGVEFARLRAEAAFGKHTSGSGCAACCSQRHRRSVSRACLHDERDLLLREYARRYNTRHATPQTMSAMLEACDAEKASLEKAKTRS